MTTPLPFNLTEDDIRFVLESLNYTKQRFESTSYPTPELRQQQLDRVNAVMAKIRVIRDAV